MGVFTFVLICLQLLLSSSSKIFKKVPKAYHVLNVVLEIAFTPTCKDNCHEKTWINGFSYDVHIFSYIIEMTENQFKIDACTPLAI